MANKHLNLINGKITRFNFHSDSFWSHKQQHQKKEKKKEWQHKHPMPMPTRIWAQNNRLYLCQCQRRQRYFKRVLSRFSKKKSRRTVVWPPFTFSSRTFRQALAVCTFLWFGGRNGVNEFSNLKLIEKHQVGIEVLVLCLCARAPSNRVVQKKKSMFEWFLLSIVQIAHQLNRYSASQRFCGTWQPVKLFFFLLSLLIVRSLTHLLSTLDACLCVSDDDEVMIYFLFQSPFHRISLVLS